MKLTALVLITDDREPPATVIAGLAGQGCAVHVLDGRAAGSAPAELAALPGVTGAEAVAAGPDGIRPALLRRAAMVTGELESDWFLLAMPGEQFDSPWENLTLTEAVARVEQLGGAAIDCALCLMLPDNRYLPAPSRERVRLWRNLPAGAVVDVDDDGVRAGARAVFPVRFILRRREDREDASARPFDLTAVRHELWLHHRGIEELARRAAADAAELARCRRLLEFMLRDAEISAQELAQLRRASGPERTV
ncbi:MAG TPA: hypothetical protein PKM88_04365 [bacterium]|nr:hypothetical protein [bacterium]